MKHILIAGADSYVGTSFETFLTKMYPDEYTVRTLDVRLDSFREESFEEVDTVILVAGIVHRPDAPAELYYRVNRDLAVEIAERAKAGGVSHFILFSTMSVYGRETGLITKDTPVAPKTPYGASRVQAENRILAMDCSSFAVTVLRPPMIYGPGCKGNFNSVVSIVRKLPVFPRVSNCRSMLYIENLNVFLRRVVDEGLRGIYFPRNTKPMNTTDMAKAMAQAMGKSLYTSRLLGFLTVLLRPFSKKISKAFGTLAYTDMGDEMLYEDVTDNAASVKQSVT